MGFEKITYVKEILYHFSCTKCERWWSISDFKLDKQGDDRMICPHCGNKSKIIKQDK